MRHPITLGAFVFGALLLALAALLHLAAARRTTGHRLFWAAVSLFVPVLGPLAYLLYGRTQGQLDEEEDVYVRDPYVSPRPVPAPPAPSVPPTAAPLPRITPIKVRSPLPPPPPAPPREEG